MHLEIRVNRIHCRTIWCQIVLLCFHKSKDRRNHPRNIKVGYVSSGASKHCSLVLKTTKNDEIKSFNPILIVKNYILKIAHSACIMPTWKTKLNCLKKKLIWVWREINEKIIVVNKPSLVFPAHNMPGFMAPSNDTELLQKLMSTTSTPVFRSSMEIGLSVS